MTRTLKAVLVLGLVALVALAAGRRSLVVAQAPPAAVQGSQKFHCTQSIVPFTVPATVTRLGVEIHGAHGGTGFGASFGGRGGLTTGTLNVTPGQVLQVFVGCSAHHGGWGFGHGGFGGETFPGECSASAGASGGGGSAVTLADASTPLVVAGGGGGGGGGACDGYSGSGGDGGNPPNDGGDGGSRGGTVPGGGGGAEAVGNGGNGQDGQSGGFGGEGGAGGGGGGGYRGGGGGAGGGTGAGGAGGGGGSSWASPSVIGVNFGTSQRTGDGLIVLTWTGSIAVTSVSPHYGPAGGGTTVTITGGGFSPDQQFRAESGEAFTAVQCSSETRCTAKTPAISVPNGQFVRYRVIADGQTISYDFNPFFTAYGTPAPPTSVAPNYGPAGGGTTVLIAGSNFPPNQQFQTEFGQAFTDVQCDVPTDCTAKTPTDSVPAGEVLQYRVIAVGQVEPPEYNPHFTAYGVPTLSSIGPTSGPAAGGTVVWLTGGIYPNGANYPGPVPIVHFGNALATAVVCSRSDGTVCGMRSPAGRGTVLVTITTPGGRSTALPFTYTGGTATPPAPAAPVHPRCTPWSGPLGLIIPWQNCTG